jgi:hypothetical protein
MSEFKWTPKMDALAQKHYTQAQLAELKSRNFTDADQARVSAAWASVYADVDALGEDADPASERALAIGRRANALIQEFTRGDPAMFKAVTGMKRDMAKDAEIAAQMPPPSTMAMLGKIFAALSKRGEMKG